MNVWEGWAYVSEQWMSGPLEKKWAKWNELGESKWVRFLFFLLIESEPSGIV